MSYRLLCGDALDVLEILPDASVDFVFTDPPYGHNNNNNGDLIHRREAALGHAPSCESNPRPIANDGPEANDLFRAVLPHLFRLLKPGCCCCCCCCGGGGPDPQFARWSLWLDEVFDFKQMVVWDKGPMGMGWHYRRSYETVLVATKPGAPCKWYDDTKRVENIVRARKIIPRADQHPTQKPVSLGAHFIRLHTTEGDVVLDPFCGSGSTGVAAVQLRRQFIGIDLSAEYLTLAETRIAQAAAQGVLL
jgi:site-specific DNA-methyltransferase (adenine-specific)